MILLELWKGKMEFHDLRCQVTKIPDLADDQVYPLFAPTENLIDCLLGKAPNRSPASLGLYAMKIIDAASESIKRNCNVLVPS
jgi:hypothetical protein